MCYGVCFMVFAFQWWLSNWKQFCTCKKWTQRQMRYDIYNIFLAVYAVLFLYYGDIWISISLEKLHYGHTKIIIFDELHKSHACLTFIYICICFLHR